MHRFTCRFVLLVSLVVLGGCTPISPPGGKSPLVPPQMPPDTVVLDIFFVRFPFGDEEANGPLWDEIDEQHFPTEVRRELTSNGFRADLVGCQIPRSLSRLLELTDKPPSTDQISRTNLESLETTPKVVRRHMQLRAGKPCEIQTSGVYEDLPVVMCHEGELLGRSYKNAQAVFIVKGFPQPDGRVRLEMVPELHYGEPRQRYVGSNGALRMELGRERRVFDELTLSALLPVGQMIVLGSLDDRPGSPGHRFFTQESEGPLEQKLLIVRLSQTQHDNLFDDEGLLPVDELDE